MLRSRQATTPGTLAHRFRRWVTDDVLPSIRRTGRYDAGDAQTPLYELNTKMRMIEGALKIGGRAAGAAMWQKLLPQYELPSIGPLKKPERTEGQIGLVQEFLAECCEADPAGRVQAHPLYEAFVAWLSRSKVASISDRRFADCLEALGFEKERGRYHVYLGLRLKHISQLG